jgi:hypothetical protein
MKTFIPLISMFLFICAGNSCNKTTLEKGYSILLDSVSTKKYYSKDLLSQQNSEIYGTWKVIGTSGGFIGTGYTPDFDYLVIKPNLIFGIIRNDSLITSGKIVIKSQTDTELLIEFISEISPAKINIELVSDSKKYVEIRSDSLNLNAPCCDRFNTHLKKCN